MCVTDFVNVFKVVVAVVVFDDAVLSLDCLVVRFVGIAHFLSSCGLGYKSVA